MRLCLVLLVVPQLLVACGGDDDDDAPLSEAEYFTALQAIDDRVADDLRHGSGVVIPVEVGATLAPTVTPVSPLQDAITEMSGLDAPDALQEVHDRVVAAVLGYERIARAFDESAQPTATPTDSEIGDVLDEWNDACAEMLEAGEDHDLSLQVLCAYAPMSERWSGTGEPNCADVADGIMGCLAHTPPVPDGFTAVSSYLEFGSDHDTSVVIGLPLTEPAATVDGLAFYSYVDGEWVKAGIAMLVQDGTVVQADFESVPENLIVLREDE